MSHEFAIRWANRPTNEVNRMKRTWRQILVGVVATVAGGVLVLGSFSGWPAGVGVLGVIIFMGGVSLLAAKGFRADQQERAFQRSKAAHQAPPPPLPPI
jgi:uncharacterized integral membrane protein